MFREGLGEPVGDQIQNIRSLTPAADAVQQLTELCRISARVHPPQSGQDSIARMRNRRQVKKKKKKKLQ